MRSAGVVVFAAIALLAATGSSGALAAPSPPSDIARTAALMIAPPPSLRRIEVVAHVDTPEERRFVAHQALRSLRGARHLAVVILHPAELRGTAVLAKRRGSAAAIRIFRPAAGEPSAWTTFDPRETLPALGVTLEDLGLGDADGRSAELIGSDEIAALDAYAFRDLRESRPGEDVVAWVAIDDGTLLKEEKQRADGTLQTTVYDAVSAVDGVPVAFVRRIERGDAPLRTEIHVRDVRYDVHVPKSLFEPQGMAHLAVHPAWTHLSEPRFGVSLSPPRG